ncbi:MAG: gamma carbonic anhydrase family protein [Candidatus Helarchaeota archaeon]
MLFNLKDKTPKIHETCFIAPNALIIGDVRLKENSSIWFNCVLRADKGSIIVDKNSIIEDNCIIHGMGKTNIGENVIIGHNTIIHSSSIGKDVLIGSNCVLMDGVVVGAGTMIEAGSQILPHVQIQPRVFVRANNAIRKKNHYSVLRKIKPEILERNLNFIRAYGELAQYYKKNLKTK